VPGVDARQIAEVEQKPECDNVGLVMKSLKMTVASDLKIILGFLTCDLATPELPAITGANGLNGDNAQSHVVMEPRQNRECVTIGGLKMSTQLTVEDLKPLMNLSM